MNYVLNFLAKNEKDINMDLQRTCLQVTSKSPQTYSYTTNTNIHSSGDPLDIIHLREVLCFPCILVLVYFLHINLEKTKKSHHKLTMSHSIISTKI